MSKLRVRLAKKLEELFPSHTVDPDDLTPVTGYWRTSPYADVYRWEGYIINRRGTRFHIGSYQTMTELVKCKTLSFDGDNEVYGTQLPQRRGSG